MSNREVMQQALEALEYVGVNHIESDEWEKTQAVKAALRAALAKPNDDYERGFIDGMKKQAQSSVDKAVNGLALPTCKEDLQDESVAGVVLNEEGRPALVEHGQEDWHCANRKARRLYTHSALQRQPQKPVVNQQMTTEPVAWLNKWANQDDGKPLDDWEEGYEAARRVVKVHLNAIERAHGIGGDK